VIKDRDGAALGRPQANSPEPLPLEPGAQRLYSLDAFRGLVILAMLVVNNVGDFATSGYFWKHADWLAMPAGFEGWRSVQAAAYAEWWAAVRSGEAPVTTAFTQLPLWKHCTLADLVMPNFMFAIGIAIPFSVAAAVGRGVSPGVTWVRVVRRAATLVVLGWVLCYFRDQFGAWWYARGTDRAVPFKITLEMDVLQLLGVAYLVTRVLFLLPFRGRVVAAAVLFVWHWAVLRFWGQGPDIPRGTFSAAHNAIGAMYASDFFLWRSIDLTPWLSMNWKGLMSVPPAAGAMLLGTLAGECLRRDDVPARRRVAWLALGSLGAIVLGWLWAFDLPFNKPRWTPSYLLYACGAGGLAAAGLYAICDIGRLRGWAHGLIVLGANSIAAYFIPIMAKVLLMNLPRVDQGSTGSLLAVKVGTAAFIVLTSAWAAWLLVRATARHIGPAAHALWLPVGLAVFVIVTELFAPGLGATSRPSLTSLTNAVGLALKAGLGHWEGGWVFTIYFVLFWWLVFDAAWRRRIFWKL
jgi:predicted acyltransferase